MSMKHGGVRGGIRVAVGGHSGGEVLEAFRSIYFGVTRNQLPNSVICRQLSIGGPEGDCYTPKGPRVLGLLIKSESYLTSLLPCQV